MLQKKLIKYSLENADKNTALENADKNTALEKAERNTASENADKNTASENADKLTIILTEVQIYEHLNRTSFINYLLFESR